MNETHGSNDYLLGLGIASVMNDERPESEPDADAKGRQVLT